MDMGRSQEELANVTWCADVARSTLRGALRWFRDGGAEPFVPEECAVDQHRAIPRSRLRRTRHTGAPRASRAVPASLLPELSRASRIVFPRFPGRQVSVKQIGRA